jgi:hypothetical protein
MCHSEGLQFVSSILVACRHTVLGSPSCVDIGVGVGVGIGIVVDASPSVRALIDRV